MDELRLERALRAGPPYATQYIARPLSLSDEVLTNRTVITRRTLLLLAVVGLLLAATLAALAIGRLLRPEGTPALSQALEPNHPAGRRTCLAHRRFAVTSRRRGRGLGSCDGLFTPAGSRRRRAIGSPPPSPMVACVVGGTTDHPDSPFAMAPSALAEIWDPATASFSAVGLQQTPTDTGDLAERRRARRRRVGLSATSVAEVWDLRRNLQCTAASVRSLRLFLTDEKVHAVGDPLSWDARTESSATSGVRAVARPTTRYGSLTTERFYGLTAAFAVGGESRAEA
jgi:hypothetical protein